MLTGRGFACCLLSVALIAGGWVMSLPELFACGVGIAAIVVLAIIWIWLPRRVPRLSMSAQPNPAFARSIVHVHASVHGSALRPILLRGPISDGRSIRLWARPGRHGAQRGSFPVPVQERGTLMIGPFRLVSTDPLGLGRRTIGTSSSLRLQIRPTVSPAEPLRAGSAASHTRHQPEVVSGRAVAAAGTELAGLRPYVEGDELRLVHWTASAKGRGLLVRTFDPDESACPVLLLDDRTEAHTPESFELAIETVASILNAKSKAADGNADAALMIWSEVVAGSDPVRRAGDAALDALVNIATRPHLPVSIDDAAACDLVVTGPLHARAGSIRASPMASELVVDPLRSSGLRCLGSISELPYWPEFAK